MHPVYSCMAAAPQTLTPRTLTLLEGGDWTSIVAAHARAQVTAAKGARAGWKVIADNPFERSIVPFRP